MAEARQMDRDIQRVAAGPRPPMLALADEFDHAFADDADAGPAGGARHQFHIAPSSSRATGR